MAHSDNSGRELFVPRPISQFRLLSVAKVRSSLFMNIVETPFATGISIPQATAGTILCANS